MKIREELTIILYKGWNLKAVLISNKMATLNGKPLMSYRVVDLKEELEKRGLSKSGAKKDLAERLEQYILQNEVDEEEEDVEEDSDNSGNVAGGSIPPSVQIDTNLEENDIVKEYMMMRQTQYQSAMEGVVQHKAVEDEEDIPLSRNRSPRKRARTGTTSDSDESGIRSPNARLKSPLSSPRRNKEVATEKAAVVETKVPEKPQEVNPIPSPVPEKKSIKDNTEDEPECSKADVDAKKSKVDSSEPQRPAKPEKPVEPEEPVLPEKPAESEKSTEPEKPVEKTVPAVHRKPDELQESAFKESTAPLKAAGKKSEQLDKSKTVEKPPAKQTEKASPKGTDKTTKPLKESIEEDEIVVSEPITFDESFQTSAGSEKQIISEERTQTEEEEKKEPAQPVTFRKMLRLGSQTETRKKRTWGDSKKTKPSLDTIAVSSSELKDIIPDIKPVLEEIQHEKEKDVQQDQKDAVPKDEPIELPKPVVEDPEQVQEKIAPLAEKSKNISKVVEIRNLVRPFTNKQLVDLLKRTGKFEESVDFWIDKIKSHAMVRYSCPDEAEETVMALDGVKWPPASSNKLLQVTFSTEDNFERQSKELVSLSKIKQEDASRKRPRKDSSQEEAEKSSKKTRRSPNIENSPDKTETKSLEVLFNKTKALPSIYWMPKAEASPAKEKAA